MFSHLTKFRKNRDYEDLDGQDRVEMDITDPEMRQYVGMDDDGSTAHTVTDESPKPEPGDETFTIQQAIDNIGFGRFQVKLSILTGVAWEYHQSVNQFGSRSEMFLIMPSTNTAQMVPSTALNRRATTALVMADAMEMMILSILSPALHCDWQIDSWKQALITTMVFAGMMFSSSIWGSICDKYGRKSELILCSVFTCYFGILSAFSPTFIWMLILRGMVGFGIGGAPQSVTLYSEFLPTASRATCVVLVEIFWAIGACFEVLLALVVMPTLGWRWLLGFSAIPLLFFSACCVWLPESARFDMTRGNRERALATLERIARENGKAMPKGKLMEPSLKATSRGSIKDLFIPELRKTTLILWIIWLVSAFSYYGIVLLTTELFETPDGCHGTTNEKKDQSCYVHCKSLTRDDYVDLTWTTFAEFPGLFITIFIIERLGRKYTMGLEFLVFSVFVLLSNMCTIRPVLTFFLFVARALISGAFQAAYVYTPEVYPTSMRAIGLGSCSGMARIGAIVTPFVAQVMLKASSYVAISIYGVMSLIAAVAAIMLPIETKGREMKDHSHDHETKTEKPS